MNRVGTMLGQVARSLTTRKGAIALAAMAGIGSIALMAQPAKADFRIGFELRDGGGREPAYETRRERIWVEPVYQTVCERVWVQPTYTTVCERVWVPERYEERVVRRGWHTHVERVCVSPAHWEMQERQVQQTAGYWQNVERQQLVCAGHWEMRETRVAVGHDHRGPDRRVAIQLGHRR